MFVRKKVNKNGAISIQIIKKRSGKSILVKTKGSSFDPIDVYNECGNYETFIY